MAERCTSGVLRQCLDENEGGHCRENDESVPNSATVLVELHNEYNASVSLISIVTFVC